jgi:hypothetical protein
MRVFRAWKKRRKRHPKPSEEVCVEWLRQAPVIAESTLENLRSRPLSDLGTWEDDLQGFAGRLWQAWQLGGGSLVTSKNGRFRFKDFGFTRMRDGLLKSNKMPHLFDLVHRDALSVNIGSPGEYIQYYHGSVYRRGESEVVITWAYGRRQSQG